MFTHVFAILVTVAMAGFFWECVRRVWNTRYEILSDTEFKNYNSAKASYYTVLSIVSLLAILLTASAIMLIV